MTRITTIIVLLCLAATALAAAPDYASEPLPSPRIQVLEQAAPAGVCILGNQNAPAYAITDLLVPGSSFMYVFDADAAACGTCSAGFQVEAVHFLMQVDAVDVPYSLSVEVNFHEAIWDERAGCFLPGPAACTSQPNWNLNLADGGVYDIAIPVLTENCACAFFDYPYGISLTVTDASGPTDGVTDNQPTLCTSWHDVGAGWVDMVSLGLPGNLSMYADIICCEAPVDSDNSSWGGLKSDYR